MRLDSIVGNTLVIRDVEVLSIYMDVYDGCMLTPSSNTRSALGRLLAVTINNTVVAYTLSAPPK